MPGLHVELHQDAPIPLDVAFECAAGQVLALVGPSGSGKTTIMRAIAGTYRPRQGRVTVAGKPWFDPANKVCLPPHRRAVGMVFQTYALFPHMTALGNVTAALDHLPAADRAARAAELLDLVHLKGLEQRKPAALSGGQQQRVAVARALAREPEVLLLDEPFSSVDKATRQRLYREIAELRRSLDMPVVLVTHDLEEAVMLADRLAVLYRGRILQTGTPNDITVRPASAEVARLLDLRNVFDGRVVAHWTGQGRTEQSCTMIDWNCMALETPLRPDWPIDTNVTWVAPDGFVLLHRRDRPSRGEHENPIPGTVETIVAIAQNAQITLRPDHDPSLPLHFSVPIHVARRNGIEPGVTAAVSILAEGIHLMPHTGSITA